MKKYANKVFTPLVLLMLFIFAAIIFLSIRQITETRATAALVAHSQEVLIQKEKILAAITDNETGSRGFIITGNNVFREPMDRSNQVIYPEIDSLRRLTRDNPVQQAHIDSLLYYTRKRLAFSDSTVALRQSNGAHVAMQAVLTGKGKLYMDGVRKIADEIQGEESRLLRERKADHEKATAILNKSVVFVAIIIIVLLFILLRKDYLSIYARQKAEEALKKNETAFALMTNNIKDNAFVMLDTSGRVITWNKGAERVNGFEKEEIIGKPADIFYTKQDIDDDAPRRNLAIAKKYGQYETEGLRLRKDGSSFWANVILIALVDDQGNLSGYSTITRDITERKKTQEQVEFLSRQINQSNDAIYIVGADLKVKDWNRGAENLYGYSKMEVLDKSPNDILKTELSEKEINDAIEQIAQKDYWTGEFRRKTKQGTFIYVRSSTTNIKDAKGNLTGYVAVSFDITEQRKLSERVSHLASLVEQSTEAIVSIAPETRQILSWNAGAEKLFGYKKAEVLGKTAAELRLSGITTAELSAALQTVVETGSHRREMEFFHRGEKAFLGDITASAIKNEQGQVTAISYFVNDISQQKALQEELKRSNEALEERVKERTEEVYKNEQRFRALIENSAEGITLIDQGGNVFYRSPASYKITGNLPLDNSSMGMLHPEDLPVIREKGAEAIKKPEMPIEWQGRFQHADGGYAWIEGTFTNLLHVPAVNAIVANYRNITSRKRFEEKLVASEERFRHTMDHMLEGVQIIGFDWRYIYVNGALAKHGKYTKEELIGYTVMEKYPGIETTKIFKVYQKCFTERVSIHLENEFVYPDQSVAWFELSFQPVPEGIFILSVDITDRKKAEERLIKSEQLYRSLFENMLHGFAYCRGIFENGRLVDYIHLGVNKEFEKVTGLKNVVWKKLSELMPEILLSRPIYADMIERVAIEGATEKFEIYAEPFNKWLSISLYSPEKEYFVILVDNISERKQAEQKIKKLNTELEARVVKRTEQLKKTNEELEAFSYSVSHDLRAPLRAIIGFTAILEDDYSSKLDDEARRITTIIKSNTLRMGHLIDDLLTFSRMGRQDIVKTSINTDDLIKEIIEQPDIRQHNSRPIQWVIHDLPDIKGDINTLRQVWINLISTAVKYSGKTADPKIEIGSWQETDKIIFYVKDNGVGFDEKYKNKLFRVFQRLHSADEFEGTGIGLAIIEKIISKHDGQVWADAEVGKGANFYFSLPADSNGTAA